MARLRCLCLFSVLILAAGCCQGRALTQALLPSASGNVMAPAATPAPPPSPEPAPEAPPPRPPNTTTFSLAFGGYDNYYWSDDTVAGVLLLTEPGQRLPDGTGVRMLVGFPDANSGAAAYFNASQGPSTDLVVELDNVTLTSTRAPDGSVGLTGVLTFNENATLYRAIVGSIRTIRDYVEGPRLVNPIFAHNVSQQGDTIVLQREYMNGTGSNTLTFSPADNSAVLTLLPDGNFTVGLAPGATQARVNFTALVNWTPNLRSFQPTQLLAEGQQSIADTPQVTQLSFLTYPEKLLAGSWRFLTYFGRDSLIATRLMMRRLAPSAIEAALAAALGNLNTQQNYYQYNGQDFIPVGTVCHEETLGDYASFTNIQQGHPELGGRLWCDYKMIDTDFLLLPSVAEYFLNTPQGDGRAPAFLAGTVPSDGGTTLNGNKTYGELLNDNANLVMALARPLQSMGINALIRLRPGQPVGNWRDSDTGLATAAIPFDVNTALVPAALRAIEQLSGAGILDKSLQSEAANLAQVWETQTAPLFQISLPASQAEQFASSYSNKLGVPAPQPSQAVAANPNANVTFYALSLFPNGTQVPIIHSDLGFNLLYGTRVPEGIVRAIPLLLSDFPAGLLTPAGMVVANPAYAPLAPPSLANQLFSNFTNGFYHGSVVWGFQQALMVEGLERQLDLCHGSNPPSWCADSALVAELEGSLDRLWGVIESNPDVGFSEVWSWKWDDGRYRVASLAETSATSTEGNAIQLWSYGFIAAESPYGNGTLLGS